MRKLIITILLVMFVASCATMGDRAELGPDRLELEAASLSVADLLDAANKGACGDRLFARFDDTLCLLDRARKEVVAYDLAAGAVIARVDLGADSWCMLWAEEPRRLVCLDPEGALILIDPAQGWSKTVVAMQGPAMPDEAAVRGSRLLVAHHGRKRLDLYDLSGGGAALLRSYPVTAASVAFLSDRYCLVGMWNLNLLDLESGELTVAVNLPEWGDRALVAENLSHDGEEGFVYFKFEGLVYAYAALPGKTPACSVEVAQGAGGFHVNAGYLYRLEPDYYAYEGGGPLGIHAGGGRLAIAWGEGDGLRLSVSWPFAAGGPSDDALVHDGGEALTRLALIQGDPSDSSGPTGPWDFGAELSARPRALERLFRVAFSGDGLMELVGLIASDETLRDACCQEIHYNEFPGTYRYLLIAEPTIVTEGLEHVEVAVFPTNPWKARGSWLLSIQALSDDRAGVRQEHERIRIGQSGYVIEDQQMRDAEDRLFIRFPLFCNPADPEAEPARIAAHLAARYPGFLSMEPVRD